MPTIPSPRDHSHYFGSKSSICNTPRTPGKFIIQSKLALCVLQMVFIFLLEFFEFSPWILNYFFFFSYKLILVLLVWNLTPFGSAFLVFLCILERFWTKYIFYFIFLNALFKNLCNFKSWNRLCLGYAFWRVLVILFLLWLFIWLFFRIKE